ncbi:MAG TPA: hypothetical protein VM052_09305 [Candidatus Limnocylindrales bacterium]|nr:hypothetical protein [Candidatus Limnocylindrales bacterium]
MTDLVKLLRAFFWFALVAAIYQELKKPPEERTWHGKVVGAVPYDFRVPTVERFREAYWAPDTDRVFSDRVVGVGWAVNIPVAVRKLSQIVSQYADASAKLRADARAKLGRGDDAP